MSTLYITQQGAVISKESERLKVTLKKELLLEIPLIKVSQIVIFGRISVTPPTISLLLKHDIEICYLTEHGEYIGRLQPEISKNCLLRIEQYKAMLDPERCLHIAKGFVLGKLANLRMMLVRKIGKRDNAETHAAVERIKSAERAAQTAESLNVLRGHEGEGSAAYFGVFEQLLKTPNFRFEKRVRRPPKDPVNALLSFGYTLLTNDLITAVNLVGFDPYIGYLHSDHYGRPSLALDLMEEFRPLVVDAMVIACLNKKILTLADFHHSEKETFRLTDEGRRTFLEQYEARRKTEFTHLALAQKMTYQQSFEQQARLLAKMLRGELADYAPVLMK